MTNAAPIVIIPAQMISSQIYGYNGFSISVDAREDGSLVAAYVQLSTAKSARTEEVIESILLVDFDSDDNVVGIEILAPMKEALLSLPECPA